MAIDEREIIDTETGEIQTAQTEAAAEEDVERPILEDPVQPGSPARQAPITQAELRQRAIANVIPSWTAARSRVLAVKSRLEGVKGELKYAVSDLERHETVLDHVGNCRLEPCLRCVEIAINPPKRDEPEEEDDGPEGLEPLDEDCDAHLLEKGEEQLAAEESDQEPVADADRVAEAEASQMDADDQVETVALDPDQRQVLEEIAAAREPAEVAG
jgi:TATA-binding protein-associated factor Taf7